jgi:hypothetical protein
MEAILAVRHCLNRDSHAQLRSTGLEGAILALCSVER